MLKSSNVAALIRSNTAHLNHFACTKLFSPMMNKNKHPYTRVLGVFPSERGDRETMNQSLNIDRIVFDGPSDDINANIGPLARIELSRYRFKVIWNIQFILREHVRSACEHP